MASAELTTIVQRLRSGAAGAKGYARWRVAWDELTSGFQLPAGAGCEPVDAGGARAVWVCTPCIDAGRVILYFHGGAFIMGSVRSYAELLARLAGAGRAAALGVDYRLAPENPFPAAVDDGIAAYRWLLGIGILPRQIAIAGDSCGAAIGLATLVALRDAGDPLPAAMVCISPWVDLAMEGATMTTNAGVDPFIQREGLAYCASLYLGGTSARAPLASPLYADHKGFPPLLIQVGGAETLLDDARRLDERARAAQVDVTLQVWDDMIHIWHIWASKLPEARRAIDGIGDFILQHTSSPDSPRIG